MFHNHKLWRRIGWAAGLALLLVVMGTRPALATEFRSGDTVVIAADEVIDDDLFISGQRVVVQGTVNGDLFAAGSEVEIGGVVSGSLFVAGQSIRISGTVKGSVYGGGMTVELGPTASVERNALFGVFDLQSRSGSRVARDLLIGGNQARLEGEVQQDVGFAGSALELNGRVGGDVSADVEAPGGAAVPFMGPGMPALLAPGLRVGQGADIEGALVYTSTVAQDERIASQPGGGVVYQTPEPGSRRQTPQPQTGLAFNLANWVLDRARDFITLLVLGGLALWLLPQWLNQSTERARATPLSSAGWGLLVAIVGYVGLAVIGLLLLGVGIAFGLITLGGLAQTALGVGLSGVGLAFAVFTFLVAYGSKLVVAFLIGQWLVRRLLPNVTRPEVWALLAGVAVYVLIRGIPLAGWLIGVIVTLIGLGAIWLVFRERRLLAPPAVASPPVTGA